MSQSYSISQTTLRKRWKISAALSAAMTFRFSKRQTMYKSYFILFVVFFFLVYSRFCLITVICSDSVLFLCSREAEYTRLGRECEALCVLTWWMCKSLNLFWYLDQSYLYVIIFCTCSLSENISVSSKPITYLQTHGFFQKQILVNVYNIRPSMQRYLNNNAKIILQPMSNMYKAAQWNISTISSNLCMKGDN